MSLRIVVQVTMEAGEATFCSAVPCAWAFAR